MKNKKLLLKSIMVLSLIFAISCKSNSNPDDTTTQTPPATKKDPVAIDIAADSTDAKKTKLKMVVDDTQTTTKADVTFTGTDATDATLTVTGLGLVANDPQNTTGTDSSKKWVKLDTGDLSKDDIELTKANGAQYKVAIKNNKTSQVKTKLGSDKYTVIGIQVKATKTGKADKDFTFYVVVRES